MPIALLVLAAGIGSRYGGLKQMDAIGPNNETIMEYSIYSALQCGVDEVIFVLRRDCEIPFCEMRRRLSRYIHTGFVLQKLNDLPHGFSAPNNRCKPWGTGHAIWCARHILQKAFIVINADDFYGVDAFHNAVLFFSQPGLRCTDFMMSSFRLANTLSAYGPVSRAICTVDEYKMLQEIEEYSGVANLPGGIIGFRKEPSVREFHGQEVVSLNFWGFTPHLFALLEENFCCFLEKNLNDPKEEFYVSQAISDLLSHFKITVSVRVTGGQWYGMTYKEDKPKMVSAIADFIEKGCYPQALWNENIQVQ